MEVDNAPHRIPELWFDDGSLIVQAGDSQFRVHRSILAACSAVFKDMLSFPQPADEQLVDDCPLVHLTDSPEEVTVFLKAIFVPDYFMPFPANTEYEIIRGCLRLSHKYGVEHLRLRALIHLSSGLRTTLSQYDDARYCYGSEALGRPQSDMKSWQALDAPSEMSSIQLAREVDAPWVLPLAFYVLSNSLVQRGTTSAKEVVRETTCNGISVAISAEDQDSFLSGHIRQVQFRATGVLGCFLDPVKIPNCKSPMRCLEGRLSATNRVCRTDSIFPSSPLDVWNEDAWDEFEEQFCSTCLAFLRARHQSKRRELWDDLPKMYGLPPWEELEKMKVAAIGPQWFPSEL
ncbi:hypothetical protein FB45DRAFT_843901 [Roridomyces roridus]|uniref:BTB domain-containing protein n=1 Tax=Roridomyces roridus TaxID=1738132 RepID=A0AAD7B656_9AGAR|nr:hypothetical protein FB45DRAFT_843901 [Roridomyces roridus]